MSCLTPALACEGDAVLTIEGIARRGKLHPLQEKFVEHGAVQCGFCTPGMIMTALAFLQENPHPTVQDINEAISGNLCRCTGYKKIIEAISQAAVAVDAPAKQPSPESQDLKNDQSSPKPHTSAGEDEFQIIGKATPFIDARKNVTGEARYADDFHFPNALYCRFLRSIYPHARIESIDVSEAEKIPGVRYIVTGSELPEKFGILPISQDQTALAIDIATAHRRALTTSGYYISPKLGGNFKGAGAGQSPSYSFGAVIAEVVVDTHTGRVKVENLWGAHDCGKVLNPLAVEGQLEGSWHMGMEQALTEAMKFYQGLVLNPNLLDYKIPTALDIPDMDTNIVESCDPEGPFGAKECGEGALHPAVPAIAKAIFDAVEVRITSVPITPEKILQALSHSHSEKALTV